MTVRDEPPTTRSCPECGGVLTESNDVRHLRYRCEDCGGYFTGSASEAMTVAARRAADEAERMHAQAALERHRQEREA